MSKLEFRHIPPETLEGLAEVLTYGAHKNSKNDEKVYSEHGWRVMRMIDAQETTKVYYDALMRHLMRWRAGEVTDPESGLPTIAHIHANAMILHDLEQSFATHPSENSGAVSEAREPDSKY